MTNIQRKQQGFTLIELIIVIVILGILAATASPKFLNLQSDAKVSTVQGLSASLKSAANIVYSKALVQGVASSANASTTNPAVNVVYGYPDAGRANIQAILEITSRATGNAAADNGEDWEIAVVGAVARIFPAGDYDGSNNQFGNDQACYVEYTEATDANTPATVNVFTDEC